MVFNSITFLVFLAIVLLLYYRLGHLGQNRMLLAASYVFYGWWDWRFLSLLLFSTFFDYYCALWIEPEHNRARRKLYLAGSMVINMGFLGIFKYFNFFADSLQSLLAVLGMHASLPTLHVVLPVGISFYTFLSMSYTIDVYRSELKATRDPLNFMLYVAFFPHLVAGPIVRASFLLPQCEAPRVVKRDEVVNGVWLILMGLVKKVVIADRLAPVVDWGFSGSAPPFEGLNAWLIIYAFAFQIYGDFSGYSDIARGLSKLMGFELTVNFQAPYLVTNPSRFWQNWHISLSTWLRDYLYIPLGGNRYGLGKTYRNLMLTMLLGGLWHGAGSAYVLWGLYHGLLLAGHRWWQTLTGADKPRTSQTGGSPSGWLPRLKGAVMIFLFFHITCVGWLIFRAGSLPPRLNQLQTVENYLRAMFNLGSWGSPHPLILGLAVLGGVSFLFQWKQAAMNRFYHWPSHWQTLAVISSLAAITFLGVFEGAQFIYFQF